MEIVDSIDIETTAARENTENWDNYVNDAFYDDVSGLQQLASKAGLLTGCDVKALSGYWQTANNILDVSSAFGRVVSSLLQQGFKGQITAIERNNRQYQYLKNNFGKSAHILQKDLHHLNDLSENFDVIFFLWSGLADFSRVEQPSIINNLAKLLDRERKLIIDTMPMNTKPLGTEEFARQSFLTRGKTGVVRTYEATYEEIELYAHQAGLNILELIRCQTDTNRMRWLYVLSR